MKTFGLYCFVFIVSYFANTNAQTFDFILWPHSVSALGSGEQGVAAVTNEDALIYNPAKLALTKGAKISYYRNPFRLLGDHIPLTGLTLYYNTGISGAFGIGYDNLNYGEYNVVSETGEVVSKVHVYERSFSAGYAKKISNNIIAGIQFRYLYGHYYNTTVDGYLFSVGTLYTPGVLEDRLSFGLSLMNIGPAVEYEVHSPVSGENEIYYISPPAQINLGLNFITVQNDYFELPFKFSISKRLEERVNNSGKSSFSALFNDWADFPKDAALHLGLSFIGNPVSLGKGFSFFSEFHAGSYSRGIKANVQSYFTHAALMGVGYKGVTFAMGYGGISHEVQETGLPFFPPQFPTETFQFEIELNNDLLLGKAVSENNPSPEKVIISAGAGETIRVGKAKNHLDNIYEYSSENSLSYFIEAAIYLDKRKALISSLTYNSFEFNYTYMSRLFLKSKFETFSFFSSYRYHPLVLFDPLFIQAGIGIYRLNPVIERTSPRYDYKTAFQISSGVQFDLGSSINISPVIDYNLILFKGTGDAPRIAGYNQFSLLVKLGYAVL